MHMLHYDFSKAQATRHALWALRLHKDFSTQCTPGHQAAPASSTALSRLMTKSKTAVEACQQLPQLPECEVLDPPLQNTLSMLRPCNELLGQDCGNSTV